MAHQYGRICGMGFDTILEQLGLVRQTNETNWQFRKRAFPTLWEHLGNEHDTLAMEFLLLLPQGEWSEPDITRFMMLSMSNPSKKDLEKFARGFSIDPLEFRKARPAKTDWIANEIIAATA
ncbi:MAG: hypothetical protein Q8R12_03235 [bacterium]|nr:hypothetical protein [bacterium]